MWQPTTDCMEIKRVRRRYWAPDSSHEMSEIGKYHPSRFCGGGSGSGRSPWQLQILNFSEWICKIAIVSTIVHQTSPPDWPSSQWRPFSKPFVWGEEERGGHIIHLGIKHHCHILSIEHKKIEWMKPRLFHQKYKIFKEETQVLQFRPQFIVKLNEKSNLQLFC